MSRRAQGTARRRRPAIAAGGAVALILILVLALWVPWSAVRSGEGGTGRSAAAVDSMPVSDATPLAAAQPFADAAPAAAVATPPSGWIATLAAAVGYSATPGGPAIGTVAAANPYGAATVLGVIGRPDPSGWAHVELPIRPNGSTGWIRTAGVALTWTSYQVQISVVAHTVTILDGDHTVLQVPAAVGATKTPTPTGRTYLWELIRPDNPVGAYGPYIFGLAQFSDAYSTFNGGDAQIGLHGNDDASSIGRPVSHGCIRLDNAVIARLAGILPLGTPVTTS